MNQLNPVYDSTLLKTSAVYQIDDRLYRFLRKDPYSKIAAPKYEFRPLPGQRRHKDLVLNHNQLRNKCYEVKGMRVNSTASTTDDAVQLGLF